MATLCRAQAAWILIVRPNVAYSAVENRQPSSPTSAVTCSITWCALYAMLTLRLRTTSARLYLNRQMEAIVP